MMKHTKTLLTTALITACGGSPEEIANSESAAFGRQSGPGAATSPSGRYTQTGPGASGSNASSEPGLPSGSMGSASSGEAAATTDPLGDVVLMNIVYLNQSTSLHQFTEQNGIWRWPDPHFDFKPLRIYMHYALTGQLVNLSAQDVVSSNYAIDVKLNGLALDQANGEYQVSAAGFGVLGCGDTRGCVTVAVSGDLLFPIVETHEIEVRVTPLRTRGTRPWVRMFLQPPNNPTPYFESMMFPIFQHGRCSGCHAMKSPSAIVARHGGVFGVDNVYFEQRGNGHRLRCNSHCHWGPMSRTVPGHEFHDYEWSTPYQDKNIDWRGRDARDICETVNANLPSDEAKRLHFFSDVRIAWAVDSGELPNTAFVEKAPPQDFGAFMTIVEDWIRSGSPCP